MAYVQNYYMKIDGEVAMGHDSSWVFLGHYVIMILDCTNMLKKCGEDRSYKPFSNFKDLELFLSKNRDDLDLQSYKILRKKISFIKDKVPNF